MNRSNIEWCDFTWNPIIGCTPCSPGCAHCYAERLHTKRHRAFMAGKGFPKCYEQPFDVLQYLGERVADPRHRRKPATVFVCSMGDLGHERLTVGQVSAVANAMNIAPQHTYVVLTKRPRVMYSHLIADGIEFPPRTALGVSVSTQAEWDQKVPLLLNCSARWRFVSIEPMLEEIDVSEHTSELDGIILGGESGPKRRPMKRLWARKVWDVCSLHGVALFFKQMVIDGRMTKMPTINGVEHSAVPWGDA